MSGKKKFILLDTGADFACINEQTVAQLGLVAKPIKAETHSGIGGTVVVTKCTDFTANIGGKKLEFRASVHENLPCEILLGMQALRKHNIDVLTSKDIIRIGDVEVPLLTRLYVFQETTKEVVKKLNTRFVDLTVFILLTPLIAAVFEYYWKRSVWMKQMQKGEKLSEEHFKQALYSLDKRELRERPDFMTMEDWVALRWEAYCENTDVDVLLSRLVGHPIKTARLSRWTIDTSDESAGPNVEQGETALEMGRDNHA